MSTIIKVTNFNVIFTMKAVKWIFVYLSLLSYFFRHIALFLYFMIDLNDMCLSFNIRYNNELGVYN